LYLFAEISSVVIEAFSWQSPQILLVRNGRKHRHWVGLLLGYLFFIFPYLFFQVHCSFPACRYDLVFIALANLVAVEPLALPDRTR